MKSKILKKVMYTYVCTYICQLTTTYLFVNKTPIMYLGPEGYFMVKIISIIIINTRIPPVVAPVIIIFTNSMLSASDVDVLFADGSKDFTIT